jgi:hypothetical protein
MNERIIRLRTHQRNLGRYERLLRTKLTDAERQSIEKRLSEERFAMRMLDFIASPSGGSEAPDPLQ